VDRVTNPFKGLKTLQGISEGFVSLNDPDVDYIPLDAPVAEKLQFHTSLLLRSLQLLRILSKRRLSLSSATPTSALTVEASINHVPVSEKASQMRAFADALPTTDWSTCSTGYGKGALERLKDQLQSRPLFI